MPRPLAEELIPENDLERALVASADVGAALVAARLFVPTQQDIESLSAETGFRPTLLECLGVPCVVALTSGSRLKGLLPAVPDVLAGLDVEASWVLRHCPAGIGLVLNPGWTAALVIAPDELQRLKIRANVG